MGNYTFFINNGGAMAHTCDGHNSYRSDFLHQGVKYLMFSFLALVTRQNASLSSASKHAMPQAVENG